MFIEIGYVSADDRVETFGTSKLEDAVRFFNPNNCLYAVVGIDHGLIDIDDVLVSIKKGENTLKGGDIEITIRLNKLAQDMRQAMWMTYQETGELPF